MQHPYRRLFLVNSVTASRLFLALPVAVLTPWSKAQMWATVVSLVLIAAIEISDVVDGHLARVHNSVSPFGKMFDPYADSVSRLIVYWSLAIIGRCVPFVPLVMAVRDVTVAYCRMHILRRGMDISARGTGKLKALVQGVCAFLLMAGPLYWGQHGRIWILGLSGAVIFMTLASMIDYGLAAVRASGRPS